ncbi:Smr/MutS family protein [Candidatus Pelagibacter sp.]|nr:Smr/MutS family protein [Candidatus Pelagibacter sp.]
MTDSISKKDKKDWENFVSSNEKLPNKDTKLNKQKPSKIRSIDLHGYSLEQANKTIEDFINKSYLDGVNKLIVITGKGLHSQNEKDPYISKDLSILKYSVPEFLSTNKSLMNIIHEIKDAKIEDGGAGAFYIYLRKNSNK